MADLAAPILHFSPDEFLLRRYDGKLPRPLATHTLGHEGGVRNIVYYRVRRVHLRRLSGAAPGSAGSGDGIVSYDTRWSCRSGDRRIDELDSVFIRYLFYYPSDEGIGGHAHDLEAIEIQLRSRLFCYRRGGGDAERCFHALMVDSVSGSAHGASWYTNTLDVEATGDTVVPLTILVEENKHASSPDRNADGYYTPHYDTNVYPNDAWGVRDVVGSGWLGASSYGMEAFKVRRPGERVFPQSPGAELQDAYAASSPRSWGGNPYALELSFEHRICRAAGGDTSSDYEEALEAVRGNRDSGARTDYSLLASLMEEHDFCRETINVVRDGPLQKLASVFLDGMLAGPRREYGFGSYAERFSFALRGDDGCLGVSAILPVGLQLPIVGGWVVGKMSYVPISWKNWNSRSSLALDVLYTPSASRIVDWYLAVGHEQWRPSSAGELYKGKAAELGVKFRLNIEVLKKFVGFEFWGVRAGLRASRGHPSGAARTRLVFELGGGSW